MSVAYIGLGSNLDDPVKQVKDALLALDKHSDIELIKSSGLYRNGALREAGAGEQPDYINAVAAIETGLLPLALLDALQEIESCQGRVRGKARWMSRTLDLDLLLYDQKTIKTGRLTVPHPGLVERNFVLYPLQQIAPELTVPGVGSLAELIQKCPAKALVQLTDENSAV